MSAVREVRRALGITQRQLGDAAGLSQSYVSMVETGRIPDTVSVPICASGCYRTDLTSIAESLSMCSSPSRTDATSRRRASSA